MKKNMKQLHTEYIKNDRTIELYELSNDKILLIENQQGLYFKIFKTFCQLVSQNPHIEIEGEKELDEYLNNFNKNEKG